MPAHLANDIFVALMEQMYPSSLSMGNTVMWSQDVFIAHDPSTVPPGFGSIGLVDHLRGSPTTLHTDLHTGESSTTLESGSLTNPGGLHADGFEGNHTGQQFDALESTENHFPQHLSPSGQSVLEGPFAPAVHAYQRLPCTNQKTIAGYSVPVYIRGKRTYKCIWPGCSREPFSRKENARLHVHKHFGTTKLFECVVCGKTFLSQGAAQRHRESQSKTFSCEVCFREFARKDYRNVHQKRCKQRKVRSI